MRSNAPAVFAADTLRNTVFSIHMYGVYGQAATINNYLNAFVSAGLPIIVGEFGFNHSDGDVDEDTIMATTQRLGLGYIGWSWSGNGSGVEYLDLANGFNPNSLTTWGQRLFNGANGIRTTSREASVYSGVTPPPVTTSPTSPPGSSEPPSNPPAGGPCTATYQVVSSWQGGFQGEVVVRAGNAAIRGWSARWTLASGQTVTQVWRGQLSTSGAAVTVTNASYNGALAANASTTFGFNAGGAPSGAPTVTCTAS
jgi:mannan endo-1,4-beta-mannosidase